MSNRTLGCIALVILIIVGGLIAWKILADREQWTGRRIEPQHEVPAAIQGSVADIKFTYVGPRNAVDLKRAFAMDGGEAADLVEQAVRRGKQPVLVLLRVAGSALPDYTWEGGLRADVTCSIKTADGSTADLVKVRTIHVPQGAAVAEAGPHLTAFITLESTTRAFDVLLDDTVVLKCTL